MQAHVGATSERWNRDVVVGVSRLQAGESGVRIPVLGPTESHVLWVRSGAAGL